MSSLCLLLSFSLGVDSVCWAYGEDMCFVNRSQVRFLAFQQPDSSGEWPRALLPVGQLKLNTAPKPQYSKSAWACVYVCVHRGVYFWVSVHPKEIQVFVYCEWSKSTNREPFSSRRVIFVSTPYPANQPPLMLHNPQIPFQSGPFPHMHFHLINP